MYTREIFEKNIRCDPEFRNLIWILIKSALIYMFRKKSTLVFIFHLPSLMNTLNGVTFVSCKMQYILWSFHHHYMFLSYKIKSIGESRAANVLGLWYFTLAGSRDLLLFRKRALYSSSFNLLLRLLLANQLTLSLHQIPRP